MTNTLFNNHSEENQESGVNVLGLFYLRNLLVIGFTGKGKCGKGGKGKGKSYLYHTLGKGKGKGSLPTKW